MIVSYILGIGECLESLLKKIHFKNTYSVEHAPILLNDLRVCSLRVGFDKYRIPLTIYL